MWPLYAVAQFPPTPNAVYINISRTYRTLCMYSKTAVHHSSRVPTLQIVCHCSRPHSTEWERYEKFQHEKCIYWKLSKLWSPFRLLPFPDITLLYKTVLWHHSSTLLPDPCKTIPASSQNQQKTHDLSYIQITSSMVYIHIRECLYTAVSKANKGAN
jgi:hypothetical protein